jgi:4a-hydroxytetrahydrobiopterin dehydratase
MKLSEQHCEAIKKGTLPLTADEIRTLLPEVPAWSLKGSELHREFKFKDFREATQFANQTAEIADREDHHPDILISYNRVVLTLTTHKINGLSMNDFIVAAKIDTAADSAVKEKAA